MPVSNDELARWAASFLALNQDLPPLGAGVAATPAISSDTLTPEAQALLRSVDAGGVPAFMTGNLRRIAEANGVVVDAQTTPNDIIIALRQRTV